MNDDAQSIKAALGRRFAHAAAPPCPDGAWRAAPVPVSATNGRPQGLSRGFAYAAAVLTVVTIGGIAAQASTSGVFQGMPFFRPFDPSKPLPRIIHRADELTIAEAQRRMPFGIVELEGLPAGTEFLYAHVLSEQPHHRVALNYQAHIANRYYRISVSESTVAADQPTAAVVHTPGHFEFRRLHGATKTWTLPMPRWNLQSHRWKHGAVVMDLLTWDLPPDLTDRIVRANTP